jgi:hypothetical protein
MQSSVIFAAQVVINLVCAKSEKRMDVIVQTNLSPSVIR